MRINNAQNSDILKELLDLYSNKNVIYWNEMGCYTFDEFPDVTFGIMPIENCIDENMKMIEPLPKYPFKKNKLNIAVFHGTLTNLGGFETNYKINWFEGYDICILGDYHKRYINNLNGINVCYSGSLIQQNIGESIIDHGFVIWDLNTKKVCKIININNEYCIAKVKDNYVINYNDSKELIKLDDLKKIKKNIKIKYINTELENKIELCKINEKSDISFDNEGTAEKYINYIAEKYKNNNDEWKSWIKDPSLLMLPGGDEIKNKFIEENAKKYKDEVRKKDNIIKLLNIEWSWILCYGENNFFNFDNFDKKIIMINAPNDGGKTSFLEIILLGLFGEPFPSRYDKNNSANIINNFYNDKCKSKPYIQIEININNEKYIIHRTFNKKKNISGNYSIGNK